MSMKRSTTQKAHKCTQEEAKQIKAIIWKYFRPIFAEKVLIAYGRKSGDSLQAYEDFVNMEPEWGNRKKAAKEYFDYLSEHRITNIDEILTDEETAIVFDSGFIVSNA